MHGLLGDLCALSPMICVSCYFSTQSADKQGNQLHMNVYKMKGQACGGPLKTEVKELKGDLRPAPPYPSRVKTVDKGTQVTPEREAVRKQLVFSSFLWHVHFYSLLMCKVIEIISSSFCLN